MLLVLLGMGLGLIWHIGHMLTPAAATETRSTPIQQEPQAAQVPARATPQAGQPTAAQVPPPDAAKDQTRAAAQTAGLPPAKTATVQPNVEAQKSAPVTDATRFFKDLQQRPGLPRVVVNERGRFIATEPILFNTGQATLRPASEQALDKVAELLKQRPEIKLEIIGHTDNLGVESHNLKVSADRAAAVRDYLVKRGIDTPRFEVKGMGSAQPISSNDDRLGRQANRRIDFLITSPK